ncbi:TIGR02281 family clan AA aspartic protease [Roseibium sp. RKSG952]|uniref:retropepsin-like aspartic protease family protein n=1 Tax=Roseibium sp. RKSG952 TaxID=2529384 RepID=UPI0012BC34FA|nr:TIGR02281 family clan AA aspartic protease [Roseibium sp. RKSG952]MTH97558.1 TIGR02281 family clan AA aspartic protease [Roseibium sp. RKSG952]
MSRRNMVRALAVAVIALVSLAAILYFILDYPTNPEDVDMDRTGPRLVMLLVLLTVFMSYLVFGRVRVKDIFKAFFVWGGIMLLLVVVYVFRDDVVEGGYRVLGALAPGLAVQQSDGSIVIVRDGGGHFDIDARVDGVPVTFLLDTGASAVVLTARDAQRAGFNLAQLSYTAPVSTANGRALVAPVRIKSIRIADSQFDNVQGFVAKSGALETSLFGMTGLDRFHSWRIQGDQLIISP